MREETFRYGSERAGEYGLSGRPFRGSPPPLERHRIDDLDAERTRSRSPSPPVVVREYVKTRPRRRSRSRSPVVRLGPSGTFASYGRGGSPSSDGYDSSVDVRVRSHRSLRHRRTRSPSVSSADSDEYEDFFASRVYEFVPSRHSSFARSNSDAGGSDQDVPEGTAKEAVAANGVSAPPTNPIRDIFQSRYTGDAFLDGSHSTELTVVQDPKKQRQPLFRWLHLNQPILNLDQLSDDIARERTLSEAERVSIGKLLAEARKLSKTKQTADGSHVKYMPPRCLKMPLAPNDSEKSQNTQNRSIIWLCIPYLSLEEYSGLGSSKNPAGYPNQTLWQAQYSGNPPQRDMEQVVCQMNLDSRSPRACLHISQLWCIILDNCE